MSPARWYRKLSADLHARARSEQSPYLKAEWDHLADCYDQLAEQIERHERMAEESILRY
jgi:hypothetical protein